MEYQSGETMHNIIIDKEIMDGINERCGEINCSPEKLVNSILYDYLRKFSRIPSTVDVVKIEAMLEEDIPNGEGILDNLLCIGEE